MRKVFRLAAILYVVGCIAGSVNASAASGPAKIGTSSVWQLLERFMAKAHAACDKTAPAGFAECVMNQMAPTGAAADAVGFTRALYKLSHGDVGIMTGFQPVGPVDIAWITYPLRANTNYGLLLVNGTPRTVNVENSRTCGFNFPRSTCGRGIATERPGPIRKPGPMAGYSSL